jgi:hypothetical protein
MSYVAGIAQSLYRWAGEPGFYSWQGQVIFIFSGTHPAPYLIGSGGSFPRVNRAERESDHSPFSSEVKNGGAVLQLSRTS